MRKIFNFLILGISMSLAWSLRGQFGGLNGAMIPGALAAAVIVLLLHDEKWNFAAGRTILLGALGFSLGGTMRYGHLMEIVTSSQTLLPTGMDLLHIFGIGAIWGGLGTTFLGFGLCEKPLHKKDFLFFMVLAIFGFVPRVILSMQTMSIYFYTAGLILLNAYNLMIKKSRVVFLFAMAGMWGFGLGFLFAVILLYLGSHGLLPGPYPWWTLADPITGFTGGCFLAAILGRLDYEDFASRWSFSPGLANPERIFQRTGFLVFLFFIPGVNALSAFEYWVRAQPFFSSQALFVIKMSSLVLFFLLAVRAFKISGSPISSWAWERILRSATLFFIWFLSAAAIARQVSVGGWTSWVPAFTLFLMDAAILTVALALKVKL